MDSLTVWIVFRAGLHRRMGLSPEKTTLTFTHFVDFSENNAWILQLCSAGLRSKFQTVEHHSTYVMNLKDKTDKTTDLINHLSQSYLSEQNRTGLIAANITATF